MHRKAKFIVEKLTEEGYVAYYAGGWVRDFLLGCDSDDIDIATNAPSEFVETLFENTYPIGAAFGIILVIVDEDEYEVATFRKDLNYADGRRPSSIEYTTALEDAKRRDFTINGMFYDPLKEEILDFVDGKKDLDNKIIRAIGNPHERIKEDKLRMIRAVRFQSKLKFTIEEETQKAIKAHVKELFPSVAIERVYQEFCKMSQSKNFFEAILSLFDFGLLQEIFPQLKDLDRKEISQRIKYVDFFPENAPPIAKLLELFPSATLKEKLEIAAYLKLSNEEMQFIRYCHRTALSLKENNLSLYDFAYLFADKYCDLTLKIIAAHMNLQKRKEFEKEMEFKKNILYSAICRIKNKEPLVKAKDLILLGIHPGPYMGELLKEAEKIAINEHLEEKEQVLVKLKKTNLWALKDEKNI